MGTWSGQPFGNDSAADWAWELDKSVDWRIVWEALNEAIEPADFMDADIVALAIAAAEVVAHGLGRPTESDEYTKSVTAFVRRATPPPLDLVGVAISALSAASGMNSELTELWDESNPDEWLAANARLLESLSR